MTALTNEVHDELLRYRRHGDAEALGRVFDRVAPPLLGLALHLAPDGPSAEDLVQTTFLTALERLDDFDPSRPLVPWLLGILRNHAKRQTALRSRRPAPNRVTPPAAPLNPPEASEHDELVAAIRTGAATVGSPYREALLLHLEHGLRAVEIAEVLQRPPATVRVQLQRGLDQLRRLLPKGLVPALVALASALGESATAASQTVGLAAIRARVVAAATDAGAATGGVGAGATAAAIGGILTMNKLFLGGVVLAATTAVAIFAGAFTTTDASVAEPIETADAPRAVEVSAPSAAARVPEPGASVTTERLPTDAAPVVMTDPTRCTITGRTIDEAGRPVAGVTVTLWASARNDEIHRAWIAEHGEIRWTRPDDVTTDADGRFSIQCSAADSHDFTLRLRAKNHATLRRSWRAAVLDPERALQAGTTTRLGDIVLDRAVEVRGVVTDTAGRAREGVRVYLDSESSTQPDARRSGFVLVTDSTGESAADGTFTLRSAIPPGRYAVRLRFAQRVSEATVDIPDGVADHVVQVVVRRQEDIETIEGFIVDQDGRPVKDAKLSRWPDDPGSNWIIYSAADGRFRIERGPQSPDGPFRITARHTSHELVAPANDVAWGTTDVRLVMRAGGMVEILAVDAATDEPVREFGVRMLPNPCSSSLDARLRADGTHEDGRVTLRGLRRGPNVLIVQPRSHDYVTSSPIEVEVGRTTARQVVRLHRTVTATVRVVRRREAGDDPVANATVELVDPFGAAFDADALACPLDQLFNFRPKQTGVILQTATTDAAGIASLRVHHAAPFALRCRGDDFVTTVVDDLTFAADEPPERTVVVSAGASVHGSITGLETLPDLGVADATALQVRLRSETDGRRYFPSMFEWVRIAADGTFTAQGLAPDDWLVMVHVPIELSAGITLDTTLHLGRVGGLADGEHRDVTFDLGSMRSVTVRGRVTVNGRPAPELSLSLQGTRVGSGTPSDRIWTTSESPAADGTFELRSLPGRIRVQPIVPAKPFARYLAPSAEFELGPGDERLVDVALELGTLALRVVGRDGEPCVGVQLRLGLPGDRSAVLPPTDDDGVTRLGHVDAGVALELLAPPPHLGSNAATTSTPPEDYVHVETTSIPRGDPNDELAEPREVRLTDRRGS